MDSDVLELIETLYTMVTEAWGVPLGNERCIVERDKVLNILDDIKSQLPTEIAEARRLVSARNEFINNAKKEAESIRRAADTRAKELLEEQEIVRAAKQRSDAILSSAEERTRELYRVANAYVDDALRRTEDAVNSAFSEIHRTRETFRAAAGVSGTPRAEAAPPADDIEVIGEDEFED